MFKYNNLPETITTRDMEMIIQRFGYGIFAKANDGNYYVFQGNLGGEPNPYYLPTKAIIANPALKFSAVLEIDKECVVIRNDSCYQGLMPIINRASYMLAETDISFKYAMINLRIPALVSAKDDDSYESAVKMFDDIVKGTGYGIVVDETLGDELKTWPYATGETLIQHLIEMRQYIYGTFLLELGINSSFNMKREAINESEAALSDDVLFPLCDDMLNERKFAIEKINKMFGLNITVEFNSVWDDIRKSKEYSLEVEKNEAEGEPEEVVEEKVEEDTEKEEEENEKDE